MDLSVIGTLRENIKKVMIGNEETIDLILTAFFAKGHVLLEDVPGTGKTVMAKSVATSVSGEFGRVQFTPDLLPSDVVGLNFYNSSTNEFEFKQGPAFCNILLADEINRATPKTQSALLECMAEYQITVDGVTRPLEDPFFVIATQNSLENLGTFPLPEAQLDRFLMKLSMQDLSFEEEFALTNRFMNAEPLKTLTAVCDKSSVVELQKQAREVYIHPELLGYLIRVIQATRNHGRINVGVSPRGTLAFLAAVRSYAMVQGREYVVPEDIKAVAVPVLAHRISMNIAYDTEKPAEAALAEILSSVKLPTEDWKAR